MKKVIGSILVVFALALLVSCSNKDEVADEIVHYYNEEWVPINVMKADEMRDVSVELSELDKEGKGDEAISLIKNEVLPVVDEALERLESVDPNNDEVKKMNDMQIEAEQYSRDRFKDTIAYYKGDKSESELNPLVEKQDKKYEDVLDYRDKLMDKYNLEYTEDDDALGNFRNLKRAVD